MMQVSTWVRGNWLFLLVLAFAASALVLLRSKPSDIVSFDQLSGALSAGQPTVVEFYSNL